MVGPSLERSAFLNHSSHLSASWRRALLTYGPLLVALVAEVIVFEWLGRRNDSPGFASTRTAIHVLNSCAVHGIMAVGMTFIILTGGIDLSVGSLAALCGVVCALVVRWGGTEQPWTWVMLGWALAVMIGLCAGGLSGLLINLFDIPPFIATLALMSSLRGGASLLTGGRSVSPLPADYDWLGRHRVGDFVPVSVLVLLVVFLSGAMLLHYTRFGRHVRAIGGNEESARLSGVPIAWTKWRVYMLGGGLTALSGLILSSRLGAGDPNVALGDELTVIAAVVVGGTSLSGGRGSITGTFVGLMVVSVLARGLNWIGMETFGQQVILGVVILAAVLLDKLKGAQ
jgi:ribose/xylose/arabinose/galactoside ABC-type transport system permease subunit